LARSVFGGAGPRKRAEVKEVYDRIMALMAA